VDLEKVRTQAQGHADAMVAGDLRRASGDLTDSGRAGAGEVMKAMPKSIDRAEVTAVTEEPDHATAVIVYTGEGREVSVLSRWSDDDDRPMITELKLL
jgi:hypothetical protein